MHLVDSLPPFWGTLPLTELFNLAIAPLQALQHRILEALSHVENLGMLGPVVFIALYTIATVALLPGSFLTLGGGAIFGVGRGSVYVFLGATLGATAAFLVGRYLARRWVSHKIAQFPKFQAIDRAVGQDGFKIVLLTRLSPVFPFFLMNYAYGLTRVALGDYVLASVGMIPGTVTYVYLGSLAGNLATLGTSPSPANPWITWSLRLLGLGATLAIAVYGARLAQRTLQDLE